MTGSNTDSISTSAHVQASALMLRLCNPLFRAWMTAKSEDPTDPYYNGWFVMRRIVEVFAENGHTDLTGRDRQQLIAALKLAHELRHDNDPQDAPPLEMCHCNVSEDIRDLAAVMALEADR